MANKHQQMIIPNFLIGIVLVTTGIFLVFYAIRSDLPKTDRDLMIAGIALLINGGLFFWGSAFVHKVKSDLIRKQKKREHQSDTEEP